MGKSKFPGKPSKVLQRKRVSVLRSTDEKLISSSSSSSDEGKGGGGGGNNSGNNGSSGNNNNHNNSSGSVSGSGCSNEDKNFKNSEDNNGSKENGSSSAAGSGACNNSGDNLRNINEMPSSNNKTIKNTNNKSIGTNNNIFQSNPASKPSEKPPSSEPPDGGGGTTSANGNDTPSEEPLSLSNVATTSTSAVVSSSSSITVNSNSSTGNKKDKNGKSTTTATTITTKKKTVTFKNIPESSDDACTVKKVYNPDIKTPLVSIIKKESLNRSTQQEPIIKPSRLDGIFENTNAVNKVSNSFDSRLTEILLKNNPNKVDKLNFLTFRSSRVPSPACGKSALSSPSHGETENPSNSKNSLPAEPDSIPVVGDIINIKESSVAAVIKSEVEKVSKDEKTSTTISEAVATSSSANPHLSSSASISLTAAVSSSLNSISNTLPLPATVAANNDKSVVIGDKRFVLPKRSAHSRRVIKPNKRFLDDSDSGVTAAAALSANRKSLASSSGNKLNRKLVVTVDSIKDNNGSLIENHKNHKVQQQLLSGAATVSAVATTISSTVLCTSAAVSPKGAVGSTTDVDDSSHLKGSNKDEDSVSSCSKHITITPSNGKNKCDIKSGGGGEADYNSDNLKGNLKRTDREDKVSECERNKKSIEENQSDATDDDEESLEHKTQFSSNPFTKCHDNLFTPMSSTASSSSMLSSSSNNKGILRQPRLQFGGSTSSTPAAAPSSVTVPSSTTSASHHGLGLFDPSNLNKLCNRPFSLNLNSTSTVTSSSSATTIGGSSGNGNSSNGNSSTIVTSASTTSNSLLSSQTNLLLSTNSCGVCNVTISSKNLQQSRKYGIFACEACRKFIKTVKKSVMSSDILSSPSSSPSSSSTSPSRTTIPHQLQCTKGDGSCSITSSSKVNMKHYNRMCKDRCQACWLKQCLKLFNLPSGHKQHLVAILPTSHTKDFLKDKLGSSNISNFSIKKETPTTSVGLFMSNTNKLISWGSSDDTATTQQQHKSIISNPLAENNSTFGSTPLSKSSVFEKSALLVGLADKSPVATLLEKSSDVFPEEECKKETPKTESNPDTTLAESNKTKLRRKETETTVLQQPAVTNTTSTTVEQNPPKRQKIDIKGPRVKHVCRSASIVLGQPIATFGDEQQGLESMDTPPRPESPSTAEVELPLSVIRDCSSCATSAPSTDLGLSPPATPVENRMGEDFTMASTEEEKRLPITSKPVTKPSVLLPRNLNAFSKKVVQENENTPSKIKPRLPTTISIDFWENYDPAEVSQTGFGIIVTEDLPIRSLCFLCGSTGMDPMVYCACCCEPYHQYCVQDEYNLKHSSMDDTMISLLDTSLNPTENLNLITNRLNWLCPRCTVCYTCNQSSGSKVKCQKCQKNYHSTCLGTSKRLVGADRPLICVNCLKCKSCGTTKVSKFIGNLPMCSQCFKLRKKGNFCPICQKCYEDNDFDLKMMECGDCQRWVHSKCEELTDEQYQMLSTLPESIEFICRKCAKINPSAKERAKEWRDAVALEFKSGLLSVVKLLSKSRQACALLKLSPRKKASSVSCYSCQNSNSTAARTLQFPSANAASDDEDSQQSEADQVTPIKPDTCTCIKSLTSAGEVTLVDVKMKINSGDYVSLAEFNYDMNNVIMSSNCDELLFAYKEILSEQFPWFQNETKACTDALEEDMFDACAYSQNADDIERGDQQVPVIDLPDTIDNCLYVEDFKNDQRACMFCKKVGEGDSAHESRLLYCGHNQWVHTNCAMWSAEVFEEIDGSLQNVHSAISRGRKIKCTVCQNRGATVGCNVKSCGEHYHYPCARSINCSFLTDKTVYCPAHLTYASLKKASLEKTFEVARPVYVELDRKKKKLIEPARIHFVIGSLEVKNLGTIIPRFSNNSEALIPIHFMCTRLYWSTKEPWKIVEYSIRTYVENNISSTTVDLGRNFTVDHMSSASIVQMAQIQKWHSSLVAGDKFEEDSAAQPSEEEPQNNADLLPPDLKDAIFEDLPHEILDGISMLDIFPNQLVTDDMITIDPKTEGFFLNEQSKDNSTTISDFEGATETASINELSIGQVLSNLSEDDSRKSAAKQRSWVKLDNTTAKRRKLTKGLSEFLNLGNRKYEFSTRKTSQTVSTTQSEDIKTKTFTWSAAKRYTCTTTSASSLTSSSDIDKLMQLDGMDDTIIVTLGGPVKCDRCHGTYRTNESYQRHLSNCEQFSTSESESEPAQSPEVQSPPIQTATQQQPISFIQNSIPITNLQGGIAGIPISQTIPTIQSIPMTQFTTQGIPNLQQSQFYPASTFNTVTAAQPQIFTMATVDGNQQILSFAPQNTVNPNSSGVRTTTTQQYYHNETMAPKQSPSQKLQTKPGPGRPMKGRPPGSSKINQVKKKPPPLQPQMATNPQVQSSNINQPQTIQILNQNLIQQQPQLILQQNATSTSSQPIILQQQPQQQTTFVATDASGNQVQYLAQQPTAQPTFLTTAGNPMLQGATFLQTDASGNLVFANTAPGIQMLSSAQLQPQVIGTIIQPQALQLASGEQLMVANSTPTLEMMGNQMILTTAPQNQPVYYGLETIVQNTVMQSQQFVSTAAMQGVLSQNASFSATTTQVFQASKIEPVVDLPSGYVLLNDGTLIQQNAQPQQAIYNIQQSQQPQQVSHQQQQQQQHQPQQPQQQQQQPPQIISNPPLKPTNMPPPVAPVISTRPQIRSLSPAKPTGKSIPMQHINKVNPSRTEVKLPTRHQLKAPQTVSSNQPHKILIPSQSQHPLRPKMVNSIARSNTGFPVIQPMQRKSTSTNMIRPLTKVNSVTTTVPIKPKIIHKPCIPQKKSLMVQKPTIKTHSQMQHHKIMQPSIPVPSPVVANNIEIFDEKLSEMVQQNIEQQIQHVEQQVEEQQSQPIPHEIVIEDINESNIVTYWPQQPQQQQMPQSNSIQLPSAPYNSNILPTNVVSPIVQPPTTPRPTNRVLPMQSIQPQKQQRTNKDDQKIPYGSPVLLTQTPADSPDLKMSVEQSVDQIADTEMEMVVNEAVTITEEQIEEILKNTPPRATDYGEAGTKIDANEDDFIPTNMEFNLKEADIGDSDDLSGGNTSPDVKEKICEILENLENEDCHKFTLPVPVSAPLEPIKLASCAVRDLTEKENINPITDLQFQKLKVPQTIVTPAQTSAPTPTVGPKLLFEIQSEDGFTYKSSSISDVWEKLFEAVQVARKAHGLLPLPEGPLADMSGVQMLGLKTNAIRYLIEQLPGVEKCKKYTPKYHRRSLFDCASGSMSGYFSDQEDLKENLMYGSARCEPYSERSPYDMFGWLASRHRKQPPMQVSVQPTVDSDIITRRGTGSNLPMAMKYRTLKETYKDYVGVFRSGIHGRGLYCTKDIEGGEMVIEYAGELIRSTLTDKRERYYDSKGIGCYMFKIDENLVVDATMRGNAARFINHSCEPNCYSKVVDILGHKHIIIFALRRILQGEELTYDYKFPVEDDKLPCSCSSKKCRKYLN